VLRAFYLISRAGFVLWVIFGIFALVSQTKHTELFLYKHTLDCAIWIVLILLQKRCKYAVGYLTSLSLVTHFAVFSFYMTLARDGVYGL